MQRVIVQADNSGRMQTDDILTFNVRNSKGSLVPFSSFASIRWIVGPTQLVGFNYYPPCGSAAPPGPAIPAAMRSGDGAHRVYAAARVRLRMDRPVVAGKAWARRPRCCSGSPRSWYSLLAALYESWTIPLSVLLVVRWACSGRSPP